jgi:type IV secretory pathway VirD2 relaxase
MVSPVRLPSAVAFETFVRQFMDQIVRDTGRRLDWLATVHHNTARTHAHILLRGRDLDGQPLYFTKDYRQQGMRYRAMALATKWMGRTQQREQTRDVVRERERRPERTYGRGH